MLLDIFKSQKPVAYPEALDFMQKKVEEIHKGENGAIWLLEHPHIYTGGTSYSDKEIINIGSIPFYNSGRGGKITYHGPGQCILYAMVPLKKFYKKPDLHLYINDLLSAVTLTLKTWNIEAHIKNDNIGVWCFNNNNEVKIGALGIRVKRWVTLHGVSVNINPDLSYFKRIIPCGIKNYGVTSCEDLGVKVSMSDFQINLANNFIKIIGGEIGKFHEI